MNRHSLAVISTLAGASLWGFSGTCAQFLVSNYVISSLFVTMVRMLGAGVLFLVVIVARHRDAVREIAHDPAARRRVVTFGIFGLFASQITYLIAISYTNAGTATVLQGTNIVMIMVAACVAARRLPRLAELLGLILAVAATLLIATQGDPTSLKMPLEGLVWGLGSAVAAAGYTMLPRPLYPRWGSFVSVGLGMVAGGLAATIVWALAFAFPVIDAIASSGNAMGSALIPTLDGSGIAVLALIAVVGTFLAYYLFLNGVAMVGAVQGSQIGAIEPVSATVCSALLTATAFTAFDWAGLALMVATIILVSASAARS